MTETELRSAIERCAEQNGAHVIDLVFRGKRGRPALELYVDSETGISVEVCSAISRAVRSAIDGGQLLDGDYRLDVSSPGADRPLKFPWQFAKHVGRDLCVRLVEGTSIVERRGRLSTIDGESITLDEAGSGYRLTVRFSDLHEARVALPW